MKTDKKNKLKKLQDKFASMLPMKLMEIEVLWNEFLDNKSTSLSLFTNEVHKLSGSSGSFGFKKLGDIFYRIEAELSSLSLNKEVIHHQVNITNYIKKLFVTFESEIAIINKNLIVDKVKVRDSDQASLIYVLEDEKNLAEDLKFQIENYGYHVKIFNSVDELKTSFSKIIPNAVVADIRLPDHEVSGPAAVIAATSMIDEKVPVIFISAYDSWKDRLEAARAGGELYLIKPIDYEELVNKLDYLTGKKQQKPYRVLIVDDMEILAQKHAAVLNSAGMVTSFITSSNKLLDEVAAFMPDLILMDLYMPECNGVDAAKVLRQHVCYMNIPIVFLSTENELNYQLDALRVGGDDFLQKPIADAHLIDAVSIRAERFRRLSLQMHSDGLTKLLNHVNFKMVLEREISKAKRHKLPLSVAMVDVDNFKAINDKFGHLIGDRVLKSIGKLFRSILRQEDISARYGGEEFGIILPNTSIDNGLIVLENLRKRFSDAKIHHADGYLSATFSVGIAELSAGETISDLINHADAALYKAKSQGKNRIEKYQISQSKLK